MDVIDELKVNVWESGGDRHCGTVVVVGVARVVAMGAVAWLLLDEDISEELGGINGGLSRDESFDLGSIVRRKSS